MKTFKTLAIHEKIYIVKIHAKVLPEVDRYKNVYPQEAFNHEVINSLEFDKESKTLTINQSNSRYSNGHYFLRLTDEQSLKSVYEKDNTIYIADESIYKQEMQKKCLSEIKKREKEIIGTANKLNDEIAAIRQNYWDVLNPSTSL